MKKKVLLLAVSCKNGALCPGGIDLDNPRQWIRIVKDDGKAGPVNGKEIDMADPLDIIEFDGHPIPQGKQTENWAIDNSSCKRLGSYKLYEDCAEEELLKRVYNNYKYHGFWGNYKPYLTKDEFDNIIDPSESILKVTHVRIYKNDNNKAKIDFSWERALYPIKGVAMTDQDFYDKIDDGNEVIINDAYIVISIPKECDWIDPNTNEAKAYKFVSRVFRID